MTKVYLRKGRDASLRRFHPWVFSGAVARVDGSPAEGDVVFVCSAEGEPLAAGHWQVGSIAVRVLSFTSDPLLPAFWQESLCSALAVRKRCLLYTPSASLPAVPPHLASLDSCGTAPDGALASLGNPRTPPVARVTNCFRLVHGEGDGLPGLIIDWYDGVAVMQAHSVGMFRAKAKICEALQKVFGKEIKAVYDKSSGTAPFKAGLELVDGFIWQAPRYKPGPQTVLENGHKFLVDFTEGQKTGFFLDQRENRALVEKYAMGKNVLNLFCYTGGFSVYALAGGAVHVDSVDSSAKAISLVAGNMELNGFAPETHGEICADAIEYLGQKCEDGRYDLMIVDPPAFAKHRGALQNALRAYQRLNAAAISKVAPGGLVFTFSCSQVVDKEAFALAVFSAAAQTGRSVRILDRMCQPADHAVNIYHPEGEYLKGLLLYVE